MSKNQTQPASGGASGSPRVVVIDGVRYVPENPGTVPNRATVWYMHDNRTFTPLSGGIEQILKAARVLAKKSTYGMLTPVTLLCGDKEIRRLQTCVHADTELRDTTAWEAELRADAEALRLIESNNPPDRSEGCGRGEG